MQRRDFLLGGLAAGAATMASPSTAAQEAGAKRQFKLRYGPHFGMFRHSAGDDLLDQLRFMADQGFTAFEDNGMRGREPQMQEKIGAELDRLGMQMGVFVANSKGFGSASFVRGKKKDTERFVKEMGEAVETAKRVNATWCTVVPGELEPRLEPGYQTANLVDMLRRAAEVCEPSGLVMVLEPLNPWRDHPRQFLTKIPQAFEICRAVDSPSCKILFDIYHQQITEGQLIATITANIDKIGHFHVADVPGRNEPGTGEINYVNVFKAIAGTDYDGYIGLEYRPTIDAAETLRNTLSIAGL